MYIHPLISPALIISFCLFPVSFFGHPCVLISDTLITVLQSGWVAKIVPSAIQQHLHLATTGQQSILVITVSSLSSLLIYLSLPSPPQLLAESLPLYIQQLFITHRDNLSHYMPFCWTCSAALNGLWTLSQRRESGSPYTHATTHLQPKCEIMYFIEVI